MKEFIEYAENELLLIAEAIDYAGEYSKHRDYEYQAEETIESLSKIHSGQRLAYAEFMRTAWGKAVLVKSAKKGEIIYRLSQSAAVIPNINLATPRSAVGRLVNIARPGDVNEDEILGEYEIEDVWYFQRYCGHEYIENIRNFKTLDSTGKHNVSISNLLEWVNNEGNKKETIVDEIQEEEDVVGDWDGILFNDTLLDLEEIEERPAFTNNREGISLSVKFYVNLSDSQYDAAHWGSHGLVFVFGVAGSGKTSVALGRSKSLSQLGQLPDSDENYDPMFSEETQIGVVRTGELTRYLKDTCDLLSLHRMPVVEYREIVEELKIHWDIDHRNRSKAGDPKFYLTQPSNRPFFGEDTKISWFEYIAEIMTEIYLNKSLEEVKNSRYQKISDIDGDFLEIVNETLYDRLSVAILSKNNRATLGLFKRIDDEIEWVVDKAFHSSVWLGFLNEKNRITWICDALHDVYSFILKKNSPLCFHTSAYNVKFVIPKERADNWEPWLPIEAVPLSLSNDGLPKNVSIKIDEDTNIEVDVELLGKDEIVSYLKTGLVRLYDGIRQKSSTIKSKKLWIADMVKASSGLEYQDARDRNVRKWRAKIREKILGNVRNIIGKLDPIDLYIQAAESLSNANTSKHNDLIERKQNQLPQMRFDEADQDVMLAYMASVMRGFDGDETYAKYLKPAPYRSSIFIDEVQDFTEIQVYLLSLLSNPKYNSVTAVGDSAQCLFGSPANVSNSFPKDMWRKSKKQELLENIRQKEVPALASLSAKFRRLFIDNVEIREHKYVKGDGVFVSHRTSRSDQLRTVYDKIHKFEKNKTVVVVVPTKDIAKEVVKKLKPHLWERRHQECNYSSTIDLSKKYMIHIATPHQIKGLEFECLVAMHVEEYNLTNDEHKNSIYVMMTRPRSVLSIICDIDKMDPSFVNLLKEYSEVDVE